MALIPLTSLGGTGSRAVVPTVLGASDTFVYIEGTKQVLTLTNITAGALSPIVTGDNASTVACPGVGDIDTSGGYVDVGSMAADAIITLPLDSIKGWLKGDSTTVTLTGADAMEATLTSY